MTKLRDQIDASVFVEHLLPAPGHKGNAVMREACRRYIYKLQTGVIDGIISDGALGEIWVAIHKKVPEEKQDAILQKMNDIIYECKLEIIGPSKDMCRKAVEIIDNDKLIDPGDALRLAEASTSGRERFVTIDTHLLENKKLAQELGIAIVEPK